jgi:DNA-binding Xre family transcriptional regulator
MIKLNIARVLMLKGIGKPYEYFLSIGYRRTKAYSLSNSIAKKMDLDDLESICLRLNCTPNDVLEWTPSKSEHDIAHHALQTLRRKDSAVGLVSLVQSLPVEHMDEVEKFILEKMKK